MVPTTRRSRIVLAVSTAVLAVSGVTAFAAIPNTSTGDIESCYQTKDGSLRVIDTQAGGTCRKGETALAWNQQGEPGPQGPQGPAGAAATTNVFFASRVPSADNLRFGRDGVFHPILTKDLPAGNYMAEARVSLNIIFADSLTVECRMPGITGEHFEAVGTDPTVHLELTSAFTHPGGPIELACRGTTGDGDALVVVPDATLLATQVNSVG